MLAQNTKSELNITEYQMIYSDREASNNCRCTSMSNTVESGVVGGGTGASAGGGGDEERRGGDEERRGGDVGVGVGEESSEEEEENGENGKMILP